MKKTLLLFCLLYTYAQIAQAQFGNHAAFAEIDFGKILLPWDGFGFNYVETCKTLDYENNPQDLGGFSMLSEVEKQEVIELMFGANGLRPAVLKMFLDPWHQDHKDGPYNHERTTEQMRYFVSEGLKKARVLGDSIQIITTLYGPPAYMTVHNSPSTSVLDPAYKKDMSLYMIQWLKYLKKNGYPVTYLSIHNEGTDWLRFPVYDNQPNDAQLDRDYNQLWTAEAIADYMAYMKPLMIEEGVGDIGLTPGEPINLFRFYHFGIADAIAENKAAVDGMDLITSHGFGFGGPFGRGYANSANHGARLLREKKPGLKTWVTSMSWGQTGVLFAAELYEHIYGNRASAIIPWAGIQNSSQWGEVNQHERCAISVLNDGSFKVNKEYYFYKQFTRSGRPGMKVAHAVINRPDVYITAFSGEQTKHPDAFTVINLGETSRYLTDMVELVFNTGEKNLYYSFPVTDPVLAKTQAAPGQMDGVEFPTRTTEDGYLATYTIPWSTLGVQPEKGESFYFDVSARDGRDMPYGHIGWLHDENSFTGEIRLGSTPADNGAVITISEKFGKDYSFNHNKRPGMKPFIHGSWKMKYDEENLYLEVELIDPTNEFGRPIKISLKNSKYRKFKAIRTDELDENFKEIGIYELKGDTLEYLSPNHSVTTFIGMQ